MRTLVLTAITVASLLPNIASAADQSPAAPPASFPLLISMFLDTKENADVRINCAELLRKERKPIPPESKGQLKAILRNSQENEILRIDAAYFILFENPKISKQLLSEIKRAMLEIYKAGRLGIERPHIRLRVFPLLRGDQEIETFLIDQLRHGPADDIGPTLQILGKIGSHRAIQPIEQLLDSNWAVKGFPKTRANLALGQIGGKQAFDLLVKNLNREKSFEEQNMILLGIGLSKDSRAKKFLLTYPKRKQPVHDGAVLKALRYLGDKSALQELERELASESDPTRREDLQSAISIIQKGGEAPPW